MPEEFDSKDDAKNCCWTIRQAAEKLICAAVSNFRDRVRARNYI